MSGQSQVNRASMQTAAGQIEDAHGQIHGIQNTLSGEVTSLRSGWQGQASDAFFNAYTQFDNEFEKVKKGLDDIHEKLVGSQFSYTQTEDEQKAASNPILGML